MDLLVAKLCLSATVYTLHYSPFDGIGGSLFSIIVNCKGLRRSRGSRFSPIENVHFAAVTLKTYKPKVLSAFFDTFSRSLRTSVFMFQNVHNPSLHGQICLKLEIGHDGYQQLFYSDSKSVILS